MARYYFDIRDGDKLLPDDEGTEFANFDLVQAEAAAAIAELTRDAIRPFPDQNYWQMAIVVRTDERPVLEARITFKVETK